jgi:methionine-rich copper-binding protein CopC
MTWLLARAAAAILCVVISVGLSEPAAAASNQPSIIVESTPAPNATVTVSEMTIDIHFNTKIDHQHSRLVLVLPNDRLLDLPANMAAAPDHLSGRVSSLTPGSYTLRWQALPVGKKLVKGEIPFTVK